MGDNRVREVLMALFSSLMHRSFSVSLCLRNLKIFLKVQEPQLYDAADIAQLDKNPESCMTEQIHFLSGKTRRLRQHLYGTPG